MDYKRDALVPFRPGSGPNCTDLDIRPTQPHRSYPLNIPKNSYITIFKHTTHHIEFSIARHEALLGVIRQFAMSELCLTRPKHQSFAHQTPVYNYLPENRSLDLIGSVSLVSSQRVCETDAIALSQSV